mmetsp:Transcript_4764/g.6891  ORF Transcript_4764/g.6891 Transcript_4764/m.6891 type:complete len:1246 (-) Transcript_4764:33-3770(-)
MNSSLGTRLFLVISITFLLTFVKSKQKDGGGRNPRTRRRHSPRISHIRPQGKPEPISSKDGIVRRRRSRLDLAALDLPQSYKEAIDVDFLAFSDEQATTIHHMKRYDTKNDPFQSWFGLNEESGSSMTVVVTNTSEGVAVTTGTVHGYNQTVYQFYQIADLDTIVVEQQEFDNEFEGFAGDIEIHDDVDPATIDQVDGITQPQQNLRRLVDSPERLDVMVLYTKNAMCSAAGFSRGGRCEAKSINKATIEGLINLAVAETNTAYELSGINTRLNLVHIHYEANYDDHSNGWETTLEALRNSNDNVLDYVHSMRNQYGADFVSMLVDTGSYCGIGYRPETPSAGDAFSLSKWSCATGYYSFGHELAHNMGCNHDRGNAASGTGYNYGYRYSSSSSYEQRFRSIMSYDCPDRCARIQYFSNPDILYKGNRPIGNRNANNVKWINENLSVYANFRISAPQNPNPNPNPAPSPQTPAPSLPPTNERMLETNFQGGFIGGAGNMFDIKAKTNLTITNFAVHSYAATTCTVEVWKKKTEGTGIGVDVQSDETQWELIGQVTFESNEAYQASVLPTGSVSPVPIQANKTQAFYVTFTAETNYNRYSQGTSLGNIQAYNDDMELFEGYVKGYRFGDDYYPRRWNGRLYYEKDYSQATYQPSMQIAFPTKEPTTEPTKEKSIQPSVQPTQDPTKESSDQPSDTPTGQPTFIPTFKETPYPSRLQFEQPTSSPTIVLSKDPTISPSTSTSLSPSATVSLNPSNQQTEIPTAPASEFPTLNPSNMPLAEPSIQPSQIPTSQRSLRPIPTSESPSRFPSDSNQVVEQLTTMFAGGNGQAGNMFTIRSSEDIVVTDFDIHTYSTSQIEVYIYTKEGEYTGFEQDSSAWTQICSTRVQGEGSPNPTHISAEAIDSVSIGVGQNQSFYITLSESKIRYTNGIPATDDGIIQIINSSGNKYLFGIDYPNRIWNGNIYYSRIHELPTEFPTPLPNNNLGPSKAIETTFSNRNGSYGNMFDVEAIEKLIIHNFWVHTYQQFGALVEVEIYALKEQGQSYVGHELDHTMWRKIGGALVEGRGTGNPTFLPKGSNEEYTIEKGKIQAFYVTIIGGGMRYSNGERVGKVVQSNSDMKIFEGAGVGEPRFGGTFSPRVFNGGLEYYTPDNMAIALADTPQDSLNIRASDIGFQREGWPCDSPDQCFSGLCGPASSNEESNVIVAGSNSLPEANGRDRYSEGPHTFCLDENGQHREDGDAFKYGTSRI